jgi:leucyl-tRNA synthetase
MGAEGMEDPDWRTENAKDTQSKLEALHNFAKSIIENPKTDENSHMEKWLTSVMQHRVTDVTENLEQMKTRTALETALFEVWNDFRWYARRKEKTDTKMMYEALKVWLRLLAPFAPHICEELWSQMNEKGFVSQAEWPRADENQIDMAAEEQENLIKEIIEDTLNVLRATKIVPKKICYYTAAKWKWKIYLKVLEKSAHGEAKINELMKELATDRDLRSNMKDVAKLVPKMVKETGGIPEERKQHLLEIKMLEEKAIIEDAKGFLAERFKAQIGVYDEESKCYDPKRKANTAMPYRPAIYLE